MIHNQIYLKESENEKDSVQITDLLFLSPGMKIILGIAHMSAEYLGKRLILSSLINDREDANPLTDTHARGDGIDIRIWGWSLAKKRYFVSLVNELVPEKLKPAGKQAAVLEEDHIHLQCRAGAKIFALTPTKSAF